MSRGRPRGAGAATPASGAHRPGRARVAARTATRGPGRRSRVAGRAGRRAVVTPPRQIRKAAGRARRAVAAGGRIVLRAISAARAVLLAIASVKGIAAVLIVALVVAAVAAILSMLPALVQDVILDDEPSSEQGTSRPGAEDLPTLTEEGWGLPVAGGYTLTGRFGDFRAGYVHMGDDFAVPAGTPIHAIQAGTVTHVTCAFWRGRSPCNVLITHGRKNGVVIQSLYVHMYPSGVLVSEGQEVEAGQVIARAGSNGNSTGPHLHLEVWINGAPMSAVAFLSRQGVEL